MVELAQGLVGPSLGVGLGSVQVGEGTQALGVGVAPGAEGGFGVGRTSAEVVEAQAALGKGLERLSYAGVGAAPGVEVGGVEGKGVGEVVGHER
jgi:hypothetical protein